MLREEQVFVGGPLTLLPSTSESVRLWQRRIWFDVDRYHPSRSSFDVSFFLLLPPRAFVCSQVFEVSDRQEGQ